MQYNCIIMGEWKLSRPAAYAVLGISIAAEQVGTACLQASGGFTVQRFTVLTILLYAVSYFTFAKILSRIDLAVAYATWTAVGSVGATLIGIWLFDQSMSLKGWLSIAGMIAGVFLLNCFGTPKGSGTTGSVPKEAVPERSGEDPAGKEAEK